MRYSTARVVIALPFLALLGGCSLAFDYDTPQCRTDADCEARGDAFAGTVCIPPGLCKPPTGEQSECTANTDCLGPSEICKGGLCAQLTTAECPLVLGQEHLKDPAPILVGAYATYPATDPSVGTLVQNYALALQEFDAKLPDGIRDSENQGHRFAFVVCDATQGIEKSAVHLTQTADVAGVIAGLFPEDVRSAFEASDRKRFFLSPIFADSSLTTLNDDGLVWNINPLVTDVAPPYQPLLARVEKWRGLPPNTMRVALLVETATYYADLGNVLADTLTIDGSPIADLVDARYRRFDIDSDPNDPNGTAVTALKDMIGTLKPDVVIAVTGESFGQRMLSQLEATSLKPFYILSYEHAFDPSLLSSMTSDMASRALGVNFATAKDRTLYESYIDRFRATFPKATNYEFYENWYDVTYFMLLSYIAAGNVGQYTGQDLNRGMRRLVNPQAVPIKIGPDAFLEAMSELSLSPSNEIGFVGAMGPPDFDEGYGVRKWDGAVYCIDASKEPATVYFDVLRYDPNTKTLYDPDTVAPDDAELPCAGISGF